MKKVFACLLALLLPCCALAETRTLDWSAEVNPEGLSELFDVFEAALDMEDTSPFYDEWIAALAECMSSFSFKLQQDSYGERQHMSMAYGEEELVSLDLALMNNGEIAVGTSLLPDIVTTLPNIFLTDDYRQSIDAWRELNWDDVWETVADCLQPWVDSLEATEEYGSFAGDAYIGGTYCLTLQLDERDMAVLLDSLTRADWPEGISQLLRYYGLLYFDDADGLLEAFRAATHKVALRNRYHYVLRFVVNDDEIVGISVLTYEANELVSTLSIGIETYKLTIVLGYGVRGENVYLAITADIPIPEDFYPTIQARFWLDPNRDGYDAAASDPANLLLAVDYVYTHDADGLWVEIDLSGPAVLDQLIHIATLNAVPENDQQTLSGSITLNGLLLASAQITTTRTEDLPPLITEDVQVIRLDDMSDEDALLIMETMEKSTIDTAFRLFKLIPARLMTVPLTPGFLFQ